MDTLFHFAVSYLSGMAVNPRLKHRPLDVLALSIISVGIDIDHLLFAYPRTFHNVFIVFFIPALLFYGAYRYERNSDSIKFQSLSILLMTMLVAHIVVDLFSGGSLRPLIPLSSWELTAPVISISFIQETWTVASSEGFLLVLQE